MNKNKIQKVLIVGGGGVGSLLATLLLNSNMFVSVLDRQKSDMLPNDIDFIPGDVIDEINLENLMKNYDAVVSCLPHKFTMIVANLAHKLGLYYFDPTEDVNDTNSIKELANTAKKAMVPQCGLAPGLVGIIGSQLVKHFDKNTILALRLRVGALPLNPIGDYGYACNWSPEGLINEYLEEANAIVGSKLVKVPAGDNLEIIRINGIEYEAFSTSGGLGTMTETYINEIDNVDYKSIRYPKHHRKVMTMIKSYKSNLFKKEELVELMKNNLPPDPDDRVLIHVSAIGKINNKLQTKAFVADYRPIEICGQVRQAILWTTAASIAAVIELVNYGVLPDIGFIKQESIPLDAFLRSSYGELFRINCLEIDNLLLV